MIKEQIDYYVSIDAGYSDELEHEKKSGQKVSPLVITVSCGGCGFLPVGPVLRELEAREKGLARAWYNAVVHGLLPLDAGLRLRRCPGLC